MEGKNDTRMVPMRLSSTNMLSEDLKNVWDDFGREMTRMREEMSRFHETMFSRFFRSPHTKDIFNTPLIQDDDVGKKQLKLRFDVSQYAPEEIDIRTENNHLLVHAKHEVNDGTKRVFREYRQALLLPNGVDPANIRSNLSADGVLVVEAPILDTEERQSLPLFRHN